MTSNFANFTLTFKDKEIMKLLILSLSLILCCWGQVCPFCSDDSISDETLLDQYCTYEANFTKHLGVDQITGFAINGATINSRTGLPDTEQQKEKQASFSIEAIHIALLVKVLQGSENSDKFYSQEEALELLQTKITAYQQILEAQEQETLDVGEDVEFTIEGLEHIYWSVLALNKVLVQEFPQETSLIQAWQALQADLEDLELDLKISYCIDKDTYKESPLDFYCEWANLFLPTSLYNAGLKVQEVKELQEIAQATAHIPSLSTIWKNFYSPRSLMNLLTTEGSEKGMTLSWLQYILGRQGGQSKYGAVSEQYCHAGFCELKWEEKIPSAVAMMGGLRDLISGEVSTILSSYGIDIEENVQVLTIPSVPSSSPTFREYFTSCRPTPFPHGFTWGASTSAYQYEGAWNEDGAGLSIWDTYVHLPIQTVYNNDTGDVALDFYHRHSDQIALLGELGLMSLRISISWSRLLPDGTKHNVNQLAVDFYTQVIQELQSQGIEVFITLYHFDLPQALEDQGGWLNEDVQSWFKDYADICFKKFGDLVKNWVTFNEPTIFAQLGYGYGAHAPGRCSEYMNPKCAQKGGIGDTPTEPYIVVHNALLAHAQAVKVFRTKYKKQHGKIGIISSGEATLPYDPSNADDVQAAQTYLEFFYGWVFDPVTFGDYPASMKTLITDNRLPTFTKQEKKLLKGSYDFLGINYYTGTYVIYTGVVGTDFTNDCRCTYSGTDVNGQQLGDVTANGWQYDFPDGLRLVLTWVDQRYNHPEIYIFELGIPAWIEDPDEVVDLEAGTVADPFRITYYQQHLAKIQEALDEGVDVKGMLAWSAIDNFSWTNGYSLRYGLIYADYENDINLIIKDSGYWYKEWIESQTAL